MSLEARITVVEARLDLQELVARYCHRIDAGDYAGAAELFAEDGSMAVPDGRVSRGREAIETFLREQLERYEATYHYVHSQVLEHVGTPHPHGVVDAHAEHAQDGCCVLAGIRYIDRYTHLPEGWRFTERELQMRYFLPWQKLDSRYRHGAQFPRRERGAPCE